MIHPSREFEDTVSALCHGTATEDPVQQLAALLRTDEAARDAYLLAVELHARLASDNGLFVRSANDGRPAVNRYGEVGRPAPSAEVGRPAPSAVDAASRAGSGPAQLAGPTRGLRRRRSWYLALGATAAMLLIGMATWKFFGGSTTGPGTRAVAVEVLEAQQVAPGDWQAGQTASRREINITSGTLHVRLADSGVRLRVSGPAEVRLLDPMSARVSHGQVTADVGEQGKGFSMETAQAKLVDLGTTFGVDVSGGGTTDVVVFRGTVQVFQDHRDQQPELPLSMLMGGEAIRLRPDRTMARIPNIVSGPGPGPWSTQPPAPERCVIASVQDNLRSPYDRVFYQIVPGGFQENTLAYVGPQHAWKGRTATGLPPYLLGADMVRTFPTDHDRKGLQITVRLSRPAMLYVLFETRPQQWRWREAGNIPEVPAWLEKDFHKIGDAVGLDDAGQLKAGEAMSLKPGEGHLVTFDVWERKLPEPGEVTLGPPTGPEGWKNWMYGILAKPRDGQVDSRRPTVDASEKARG